MAGPRHPVSVSGAAMVQTDRLQVGTDGTPASPKGEGGSSWPSASKKPSTFHLTDVHLFRVLVG